MSMISEVRTYKFETKEKVFGILVAVLSLVIFYSYIYGDITTTARMGISLWDNVFNGTLRAFYQDRVRMTTAAYVQDVWATYDFPIYIIFAVWNFPLWLLEHFAHMDVMNNAVCLMWIKTMLLPFLYLFMTILFRVCRQAKMSVRQSMLVCVLMMSSEFVVSSVFIISQYDIIGMCFVLLGINAYLENDMKKFCFWFAVATPLKLFAILIFVPLLVLKEKRLGRIIGYLAVVAAVLEIIRIIIPTKSNNLDENGQMMIQFPFEYTAHLGLNEVYLFVMLMGIIVLVCYFVKIEDEKRYFEYVAYLCFIVYFVEFSTMKGLPYWLIMMVPYISIITVFRSEYFAANAILDFLMGTGLVFAQMFRFDWCFDSNTVTGMFWPLVLGQKAVSEPLSFVSLLSEITAGNSDKIVEHAIGLGSSVFVGCGIIFAVLNCPLINRKFHVIQTDEKWGRIYLVFRVVVAVFTGMIPLALYVLA